MDAVVCAIKTGDVKQLQALLPQLSDIDAFQEGFTCLHKAIQSGDEAVVSVILLHGADVNLLSSQGDSSLLLAVKCDRNTAAVDTDPVVDALVPDASLGEILSEASDDDDDDGDDENEQSSSVKQDVAMIISGELAGEEDDDAVSWNSHDSDNSSCSDDDMVAEADKMDVEDSGLHPDGAQAPLPAVKDCQPLRLVQLLLSHGCEVDTVDSQGNTALAIAAQDGHLDVVKLLLSQGAEFNGKQGQLPLYGAVYHGRLEVVQHLLTHPQAADALLDKEHPVLQLAFILENADIVRELRQHGADASQVNKWGVSTMQTGSLLYNRGLAMQALLSQPSEKKCLSLCETLESFKTPLHKETLAPFEALQARLSAQEEVISRQASQLLQAHKSLTSQTLVACNLEESLRFLDQQLACTAEQCTEQRKKVQSLRTLHNLADSAQLPGWCQALGSDRHEREKAYKAILDRMERLFQSRLALCSQALQTQDEGLQSGVESSGLQQYEHQTVTEDVKSVRQAISQNVVQLGLCKDVLDAFKKTATAKAEYEAALTDEQHLLEKVTVSWQQRINDSSALIERSRQRQQLRSLQGKRQQAEEYIREVEQQNEALRQMQDLKKYAEEAIAVTITLQERHRDITCKLIHARAELQNLYWDNKQAECARLQLDIDAMSAELASLSTRIATRAAVAPDTVIGQLDPCLMASTSEENKRLDTWADASWYNVMKMT